MSDVFNLISTENKYLLIALVIWTIPWKGLALWRSAQKKEKWWFIAILLTNTVAILEILYLYVFSKKQKVD